MTVPGDPQRTAVKSRRRKIFSRRKRGLIPVRIAFPFPSLSETPTPVVVERPTVSWRLFILLGLNSTGLTPLFTRTCFGGGGGGGRRRRP